MRGPQVRFNAFLLQSLSSKPFDGYCVWIAGPLLLSLSEVTMRGQLINQTQAPTEDAQAGLRFRLQRSQPRLAVFNHLPSPAAFARVFGCSSPSDSPRMSMRRRDCS